MTALSSPQEDSLFLHLMSNDLAKTIQAARIQKSYYDWLTHLHRRLSCQYRSADCPNRSSPRTKHFLATIALIMVTDTASKNSRHGPTQTTRAAQSSPCRIRQRHHTVVRAELERDTETWGGWTWIKYRCIHNKYIQMIVIGFAML